LYIIQNIARRIFEQKPILTIVVEHGIIDNILFRREITKNSDDIIKRLEIVHCICV